MSGLGLPYHHFKRSEKCLSFAVRWAMLGKFKTGILLSADLRASPHIYSRRSGALVNDALETIFFALFHTAIPIQPPPLRGTSFHRKEGVTTRAPSLGRGCRVQRGGVGFLFWAAKPPPLCLPPWERRCVEKSGILVSQPSLLRKGDRAAALGGSLNDALETISLALFHTAFPIQPPPLRGTSSHRKEGVST